MNAMMEFVSGRCKNEMYCAVASAGDVVRVPVGSRFVCSYCGNELVEALPARRKIGLRAGAIIGGGMGLTGLGLFAVGAMLGGPPEPTPAAARVAPLHATASVRPAQASLAQTSPIRPPAAQAPPVHAPMGQAAIVQAPTVQVTAAQAQQVEIPASVVVAMAEPARMLAAPDQINAAQLSPRTGTLVVAPPVKVTPAIAEMPAHKVAPIPAPAATHPDMAATTRHTQAASNNLAATSEALPSHPMVAPSAPSETDALNDAEVRKQAVVTPRPAPAVVIAAQPTGPTRAFVPHALTGGAPAYPAAYESDGANRTGHVMVDCRIDPTGAPSGCRLLSAVGGSKFGSSVMNWLGSGRVRFAPILRNGQATAETHQWSIDFQP